ncbi:LOB domain-containing protein 22-like isoform X2 [Tasmannia lanceolata]|uniref:LOB domain-containing protein 22-like isoform X2 n=1 Tax=Tasmannia lanceolata TaxID=3420 RepID=UPI004063EE26
MSVRGGNGSGSGTQACAACKYQRRKCAPQCVLAPYFPPDQQRQFLNAHKLFGVSNILKIIKHLAPVQKPEAMKSIIFESDARARDPVGGSYKIIVELQRQIDNYSAELQLVNRQLQICRDQARSQEQSSLNAYNNHPIYHQQQQQQQQSYHYSDLHMMGNQFSDLHILPHANKNFIHPSSSSSSIHMMRPEFVDECEAIKQELNGKQAFLEESFPCSSRMAVKEEQESSEHDQEHDLKGVASFLTLTNCNTSQDLLGLSSGRSDLKWIVTKTSEVGYKEHSESHLTDKGFEWILSEA